MKTSYLGLEINKTYTLQVSVTLNMITKQIYIELLQPRFVFISINVIHYQAEKVWKLAAACKALFWSIYFPARLHLTYWMAIKLPRNGFKATWSNDQVSRDLSPVVYLWQDMKIAFQSWPLAVLRYGGDIMSTHVQG